jgi:aspartyl-tRNA synthetase
MQQNLITRSNFVHKCRQFLAENNFIDIETPTLFRRTPGGAREFIVPTKTSQQFYSLTQSPQQFKQLLMIAGLDRYYQVARCYRDESTKPDRQPEFTQIDIEMSFIDQNDCIQLIESLIQNCWPLQLNDIKFPFKRMDYDEAMRSYGVDKPDLRFDMKFVNMTNFFKKKSNMKQETGVLKLDSLISDDKFSIYAFKVSSEYGINEIDIDKIEKEFKNIIKNVTNKNSTDLKHLFFVLKNQSTGNNIAKYLKSETRNEIETFLQVDSNELVILMASNNEQKMQEILGKYRLRLADLLDEVNLLRFGSNAKFLRDPKVFNFLWVVNFPLFTLNEETNKLESTHHPFTAPINEHLNLVKESKDLDKVIGQHYDLVVSLNN